MFNRTSRLSWTIKLNLMLVYIYTFTRRNIHIHTHTQKHSHTHTLLQKHSHTHTLSCRNIHIHTHSPATQVLGLSFFFLFNQHTFFDNIYTRALSAIDQKERNPKNAGRISTITSHFCCPVSWCFFVIVKGSGHWSCFLPCTRTACETLYWCWCWQMGGDGTWN